MKITRNRKSKTGRATRKELCNGPIEMGVTVDSCDLWVNVKYDADNIPLESYRAELTYEELKQAIESIEEMRRSERPQLSELNHLKGES